MTHLIVHQPPEAVHLGDLVREILFDISDREEGPPPGEQAHMLLSVCVWGKVCLPNFRVELGNILEQWLFQLACGVF